MEPHHAGLDPSLTQYFTGWPPVFTVLITIIIIISVVHANAQITRNVLIGVLYSRINMYNCIISAIKGIIFSHRWCFSFLPPLFSIVERDEYQ